MKEGMASPATIPDKKIHIKENGISQPNVNSLRPSTGESYQGATDTVTEFEVDLSPDSVQTVKVDILF